MPTDRRNQGQRDVEVHIQGVRVVPGDWLYADVDGMVVSSSPLL
jgi:regulator of ribonuclease activity A